LEEEKSALDLIKEAVAYLDIKQAYFRFKDIRQYIWKNYPETKKSNQVNALLRQLAKISPKEEELNFILPVNVDLYELNKERYKVEITIKSNIA